MLHINLLPPYIYEGKRKKQLIAVWSVVGAATVGLFLFTLSGLNSTLAEEEAKKQTATTLQGQYAGLDGQITGVKSQINETQQKQDFIDNSQVYNDSWRPGFLQVRDVVNPRIVLKAVSFDPSRSAVNMDAFAPSELDAIKWWMVLLNQTDKFTNVNITLPPHGYEPGGGTATGAGGSAPGGSMGGGFGARGMSMAMMGAPGGGSMGGGSMGGGAAAAGSTGEMEGRPGFDFVCIAGLVNPLKGGPVPPSWAGPGAGGAAPASGGFGGGMMGGMSGGSMGMGGGMGMSGGSMGMSGGSR